MDGLSIKLTFLQCIAQQQYSTAPPWLRIRFGGALRSLWMQWKALAPVYIYRPVLPTPDASQWTQCASPTLTI